VISEVLLRYSSRWLGFPLWLRTSRVLLADLFTSCAFAPHDDGFHKD